MASTQSGNNDAKSKIAMLRGLRQVREFGPEPVPDDVINDILEVGRWTGSGMNNQPWEFVVVRDPETLQALSQGADENSHLKRAKIAVVVVMANAMKEIETYDEARLTERMMLAAATHGVGAGIWWFKDGGAAAKHILGIPQERRVRTAISLGYPSQEAASRPKKPDARKPLSELVHWDRY